MRRSAAPSQAKNFAKKPKFVVPPPTPTVPFRPSPCSHEAETTVEFVSPVSDCDTDVPTARSRSMCIASVGSDRDQIESTISGISTQAQPSNCDKSIRLSISTPENYKKNNCFSESDCYSTFVEGSLCSDGSRSRHNVQEENSERVSQLLTEQEVLSTSLTSDVQCHRKFPEFHSLDHQNAKSEWKNLDLDRMSTHCQGQSNSSHSSTQLLSSSTSPSLVGRYTTVNISSPIPTHNTKGRISTNPIQNKVQEPAFRMPHQKNNSTKTINISEDLDETKLRYFSVVWCKLSKKKHKKWEGDAVLTTRKRSATLYDMEGKLIGKGTGYKVAELETLKDDETLVVGGKEIMVMSTLTEEYFKSGKCFTGAGSCVVETCGSDIKTNSALTPKPFVNPMKSTPSGRNSQMLKCTEKGRPSSLTCRHDASLPDALVMPRPTGQHQWKNNQQGFPVVDVVVDPYLSTTLRNHQRQGVVFLYECVMGRRDYDGHGAILADDMGLGKTLQCIALIWTLLKQGPYGKPVLKKVLIVTPGSLVKNWSQEFKKWLGVERLSVYAVSSDNRIENYMRTELHPVLIISYEMFVRCYETIKEVSFDLVVCDEGHRLKNTAIKTTSLIMSLPCRRRIVLTGTPIQNDLQEFYSIVEFCNPGILCSSAGFRRVYEDPIVLSRQPKATKHERELGEDRAEELTRLTQMFVLRRTQEINNEYLPCKVELVLFCQASPLQHTLYQQLIKCNLVRQCLHGNLKGSPHLICIGALKQLCNHPGLLYKKAAEAEMAQSGSVDSEPEEESIHHGLLSTFPDTFDPCVVSPLESGKLQVLSGILASIWCRSRDEKVVLVSNHTKTLDFLQIFCSSQGYSCVRLDGQTPTTQRLDIVNRFNNKYSPHRIFLLSSKAGGVGLNLVGASRLILYDIDWNPANDLQAMARVWRDGQKRTVHIYRLLTAGTIEEKMYQRQIAKQGLSGAVMDATNKNNVQFSVKELKNLFSFNEKTKCETHDLLQCACNGDPSYGQENVEPSISDERLCQLGKPTNDKTKSGNLTMAELLQWKHLKGEFVNIEKTWCLEQAIPAITFMFWYETNTDNTAT